MSVGQMSVGQLIFDQITQIPSNPVIFLKEGVRVSVWPVHQNVYCNKLACFSASTVFTESHIYGEGREHQPMVDSDRAPLR